MVLIKCDSCGKTIEVRQESPCSFKAPGDGWRWSREGDEFQQVCSVVCAVEWTTRNTPEKATLIDGVPVEMGQA